MAANEIPLWEQALQCPRKGTRHSQESLSRQRQADASATPRGTKRLDESQEPRSLLKDTEDHLGARNQQAVTE